MHRAMPNVIGFSFYYRKCDMGFNHMSIVENTLWKANKLSWADWWQTYKDRRDIKAYVKGRWMMN